MQTYSNYTTLSPQLQSILPILDNLKADDYDFLLNFLKNKSIKKSEQELPLSREEIAKKRFNIFPNAMTMSDDFDDYLGDEFWLGKDA